MTRKNSKGFTLVELMIVITVILVLMTLFLTLRGPVMSMVYNLACQNNLKAFDTALAVYRNDNGQQLPPYSGTKFITCLYRAVILTDKKYFLCPSKEGAEWIETGPMDARTSVKMRAPAPGETPAADWGPFLPKEICYAGRKNDPAGNNPFRLTGMPVDPTPLVSDNTINLNGEHNSKYAPHGGHGGQVNVLLTNGNIIQDLNVTVGQPDPSGQTSLESLLDDNDNRSQ